MKNEKTRMTNGYKFDLYFWVDNKAKQSFFKFIKRYNNKKYRKYIKRTLLKEVERG